MGIIIIRLHVEDEVNLNEYELFFSSISGKEIKKRKETDTYARFHRVRITVKKRKKERKKNSFSRYRVCRQCR